MIAKNCGAAVPEPGELTQADRDMLWLADGLPAKARAAMEGFAVHTALAEIWAAVAEANRYFASQEPWVLRKSDPVRMATVLYVSAEVLRAVGILAQPFVPDAAAKLLDLLAVAPENRVLALVGPAGRLVAGTALPQPQPIFPRYIQAEAS
jgi:methionyl-tRNA synthetase